MFLQGIAIVCLILTQSLFVFICLSITLGLGTALVYPTFLNTIAAAISPMQRAEAIGVFRLWRDLGYVIGAIVSGITADYFGISYAILSIGVLTVISSLVIRFRMPSK